MGRVAVALRGQADEIADIPLLDLMNALGAPIGNDVAPKKIRNSATRADLRDVFANEGLDQVINPIDDQADGATASSPLPDRGHRTAPQRSFVPGPWPSAG